GGRGQWGGLEGGRRVRGPDHVRRLPFRAGLGCRGYRRGGRPGCTEFSVGDEVFGCIRNDEVEHGTYAELVAAPVRTLAHKPASLSWQQAAGVPLAGLSAWQSLARVRVAAGGTVLGPAASCGVGTFAVQNAVAPGGAPRPSGRLGRLCTALPTATGPPRHCHVRPHFTVVLIVAVLLAGLGSCVLDVTVEVSTTVALPVATRTIVTVAVAPLSMLPSEQVTLSFDRLHVPTVVEMAWTSTSCWLASELVSMTLFAESGPLFRTATV